MKPQCGTLTIYGRACPVAHAALVLVPPSEDCSSFSLYLHADTLGTGGGFLMLDHLSVGNVKTLDDLRGSCISFRGDDPHREDTVGSEPVDLETSGWTFPGYEDDDSKNWHFESFHAAIENVTDNRMRIRVKCQLSNWINDTLLEGEGDFEALGMIGMPPLYDEATGTWSQMQE